LGGIGWLFSGKPPVRFGQLWVTKAKAQSNFRSGVEEGASDLPLTGSPLGFPIKIKEFQPSSWLLILLNPDGKAIRRNLLGKFAHLFGGFSPDLKIEATGR